MTVERRLIEALRGTADFAPSPDLFTRVARSINEDRAHRRRIRFWVLAALLALAAVILLFTSVAVPSATRRVVFLPRWSLELVETGLIVALLLVFGPMLRRFGSIYVGDIFFINADQAFRFVRLLEIAYYLAGFGYLLATMQVEHFDRLVVMGHGLDSGLGRLGAFLAFMGLGHAQNLLLLPLIGPFYTATMRRVLRHRAGADAPPIAETARRADRIVTALVFTMILLGLAGLLALVGIVLASGVET